jgi:dihydroorotate dehydrogenase
MSIYRILRPLVFLQDAEKAHDRTISLLKHLPISGSRLAPPELAVRIAGINFPSVIGLAAGFDKNGEVIDRMFRFGFGSVEIGTVTPKPQGGNTGKRLFRISDKDAVINRFGFNNHGHDVVEARLADRHRRGVLGVNIGANRDSPDRMNDYVLGVRRFSRYADYLTVNVSSPNTPGLRDLQTSEHLPRLIERIVQARDESHGPPVFLKLSPDLSEAEVREISSICLSSGIDALIISNTTVSRPNGIISPPGAELGGLSGKPLKPLALEALRRFRTEIGARLPLIGVGGISSASDAYERIRAGASMVQVYTALAFDGPAVARQIESGLLDLLRADGFKTVADAVGAEPPRIATREPAPASVKPVPLYA